MDRRPSSHCEDRRFDMVMERVGYEGQFQRRFNFVFSFVLVIAAAMPYLNIILVLAVPDHWCHIPGRENTNYTLEEWKNLTLPKELDTKGKESVSKCQMYNVSDYTIILNLDQNLSGYEKVTCQFGWEFDKTWYSATAPTEGEWVCDKELYVSNAFAFGRISSTIE